MKAPLAAKVVPIPNGLFESKSYVFNPSILRHRGALLLAARANDFRDDPAILLCRLGPDYMPVPGSTRLFEPRLRPGQFLEDPRLFAFRGDLYCACTLMGMQGQVQSQGLWRIDEEGRELESHTLLYGQNHNLNYYEADKTDLYARSFFPFSTEKNWQFFDHEGTLHFVYSPEPHVTIGWDLEKKEALSRHKAKARFEWPFGTPRGGTPPVRVGDEYFSFFHARYFPKPPPFPAFDKPIYGATLYSFEAKPPFRPKRWVPFGLMEGDPYAARALFGPAVAYASGAVFENGAWIVSCGVNDRSSALVEFDHELLLQKSVGI